MPEILKLIGPIMQQLAGQTAEREAKRLDIFNRAFNLPGLNLSQKVALAVAYLGGGQ
jgi:hypothetical protein